MVRVPVIARDVEYDTEGDGIGHSYLPTYQCGQAGTQARRHACTQARMHTRTHARTHARTQKGRITNIDQRKRDTRYRLRARPLLVRWLVIARPQHSLRRLLLLAAEVVGRHGKRPRVPATRYRHARDWDDVLRTCAPPSPPLTTHHRHTRTPTTHASSVYPRCQCWATWGCWFGDETSWRVMRDQKQVAGAHRLLGSRVYFGHSIHT